ACVGGAAAGLRSHAPPRRGAASAVPPPVPCAPAASVGVCTRSGFVVTTVTAAPGSSDVAFTATLPRNAGSGTSSTTTPTAWPVAFWTSIVYVTGVTAFTGATAGATDFSTASEVYGWKGQFR